MFNGLNVFPKKFLIKLEIIEFYKIINYYDHLVNKEVLKLGMIKNT